MARQQEHNRIAWLLALCVAIAAGWLAYEKLLTSPDHVISTADTPPVTSTPAPSPISVRSASSVKAPIGGFTISADRVSSSSASLTVTSETKDKYHFKKVGEGQRLMIPTHDGMYYLDIVRVHGGGIDLTMGKQ